LIANTYSGDYTLDRKQAFFNVSHPESPIWFKQSVQVDLLGSEPTMNEQMKDLQIPSYNNKLAVRDHTYLYAFNNHTDFVHFTISYSLSQAVQNITVAWMSGMLIINEILI